MLLSPSSAPLGAMAGGKSKAKEGRNGSTGRRPIGPGLPARVLGLDAAIHAGHFSTGPSRTHWKNNTHRVFSRRSIRHRAGCGGK